MSSELVARIRKQREFKIKVGRFTFVARRPTQKEFLDLARGNVNFSDIAAEYVVDWDGITEDDVVGGGGSDKVKFDPRVWREWVADRSDFWEPIAQPILDAYTEYQKHIDELSKNSQPGSN